MGTHLDSLCNCEWLSLADRARFSARALAKLCGICQRRLEQYFAVSFGRPPQVWLDELRLCMAHQRLLGLRQVKEVASELGFANGSHFDHEFKRYHGCTPTEFVQTIMVRWPRNQAHFAAQEIEDEAPASLRFSRALHALFSIHRQRHFGNHAVPKLTRPDCERCKAEYPCLHLRYARGSSH